MQAPAQPAPAQPGAQQPGAQQPGAQQPGAQQPAQATAAPAAEQAAVVGEEEFDPNTKERLWQLRTQSGLRGSTGMFRTYYAGSAPVGTFRFGLLSSYYSGSGFLCPQCEAPDGGPADVKDDVSRVGAHVQLSVTPFEFLEAYLGVHSTATSNDRGDPELLQVLGDTTWGVKAFMPHEADQVFTAGGALELWFLNGTGNVGIDGASVALRALSTLDFSNRSEASQRVPLRLNLNLAYVFDNSGNLVESTENERRRRITRVERYGLNVNRLDRFVPALGIEGTWEVVRPYFEWSIDIPMNRQGYTCVRNDVHASDSCLSDDARFSAVPARMTLGARAYPFMDNLAFHLALDIGTGGTNAQFWEEVQPETPWNFYFGVAYAVDTQPVVKVRTVEAKQAEPPPPEPQYFIEGVVIEAGTENTPVPNAIVRYEGRSLTGMVAGDAGQFRSAPVEPGSYTFAVTAEDYEPGQCTITVDPNTAQPIDGPAAAGAQPVAGPGAAAQPGAPGQPAVPGADAQAGVALGSDGVQAGATGQAAAPAGQAGQVPAAPPPTKFLTRVRCELKAKPKVGNVDGFLLDGDTNQPIGGARVTITDPLGRSLTLEADEQGAFRFENVPPGNVQISVQADDYMRSSRAVEILPRQDVEAKIRVFKRPRRANVVATKNEVKLRKPILFNEGTAELTPESQGLVDEIAALLRERAELGPIEVQGHTDNSGAPDFNMQLSQERAAAVRQALIRNGVDASRLTAKGYGDTQPLKPNDSDKNRALNRRVQLIIQQ